MRRLTSLFVDDTMLPKKQNSHTVSSSSPSRIIRFSDEVMTLHLEKFIFIPHYLQAACNSSIESCNFSSTVDIIVVSSAYLMSKLRMISSLNSLYKHFRSAMTNSGTN